MNGPKRSLSHDATRTRRSRRIALALAATAAVAPTVAAQPPIRENPYTARPTRIAAPEPATRPSPEPDMAPAAEQPSDPAPPASTEQQPRQDSATTTGHDPTSTANRAPTAEELTDGTASGEVRRLFEQLTIHSVSTSGAEPVPAPDPIVTAKQSNPATVRTSAKQTISPEHEPKPKSEPESAPRIAFTTSRSTPNHTATANHTANPDRPSDSDRRSDPTTTTRRLESTSPMPETRAKSWLPSATAEAVRGQAAERLARASHEYRVRAWASAEASAWEALRLAAVSIDAGSKGPSAGADESSSRSACEQLDIARVAILEARGFTPLVGSRDTDAVRRLVRSHQTTLLRRDEIEDVSAAEAIDRYLNEARKRLAPVAEASPEAAEAMDLIAAIYLARDESKTLPGPTSLALRRAAFQGQSDNASLAKQLGKQLSVVGLLDESRWVLSRSLALQASPDAAVELVAVLERMGDSEQADEVRRFVREQGWDVRRNTPSVPQVTELTPEEFATISQPVNHAASAAAGSAPASSGFSGQLPRHLAVPPSLSRNAQGLSGNAQSDFSRSDIAADRLREPGTAIGNSTNSPQRHVGDGDDAPRSAWRRMTDSFRRLW